ncbi:hypothetical protein GCM10009626_05180 [Brachybacterium sacelli]
MLGEVEIQLAIEAPRNPPVDSGFAIAVRRTRRSVRRDAVRTIRAASPRVRPRFVEDAPEPDRMVTIVSDGPGRTGAARAVSILTADLAGTVAWDHEDPAP